MATGRVSEIVGNAAAALTALIVEPTFAESAAAAARFRVGR
jgi:hypothetical protein